MGIVGQTTGANLQTNNGVSPIVNENPVSKVDHTGSEKPWLKPFLIISISLVVVLSSLTTVDRAAEDDFESLFHRALITFALARTLNGVISAVQGTELALQPAGVGVTLTPGEILDPVNDLIERFSWIMLGASLSLGVQQVLLDIGQWWGTRLVVALLALAWLFVRLWKGDRSVLEQTLVRALIIALFLRFAVPLALIANEAIYHQFLEARYVESTQVIEAAGAEIEAVNHPVVEEDAAENSSFFDSLGKALDSTRETLNLKERVEIIRERATELIENLIQLSVVFILQTGILPLVFLWLLIQLMKRAFRVSDFKRNS